MDVSILSDIGEEGSVVTVCDTKLHISKQDCPTFLKDTLNVSHIFIGQDAVQISAAEKMRKISLTENVFRSSTTEKTDEENNSELDITGSPLRCHFNAMKNETLSSCSEVEAGYGISKIGVGAHSWIPISHEKSCDIISYINHGLNELAKVDNIFTLPIFLVCYSEDRKNIWLTGVYRSRKSSFRYRITSQGSAASKDSLVSIDALSLYTTIGFDNKRVDSTASSSYHVFNCGNPNISNLSIHCTWKRPLSVLAQPAPGAATVIKLYLVSNDNKGIFNEYYKELSILDGFIKGLKSGEMPWLNFEDSISVSDQITAVFEFINNKDSMKSNYFEKEFYENFITQRKEMDFPDLLWISLAQSKSLNELMTSIMQVFNFISSGVTRPSIHMQNTTMLASILRDLMRGQKRVPTLSPEECIKILIEIGLEKIKKDFIYILSCTGMALEEEIMPYISCTPSKNTIEECFEMLQKLYIAFRAYLLLSQCFGLPVVIITKFLIQVFDFLIYENIDTSHEFVFDVPATMVKDHCNVFQKEFSYRW